MFRSRRSRIRGSDGSDVSCVSVNASFGVLRASGEPTQPGRAGVGGWIVSEIKATWAWTGGIGLVRVQYGNYCQLEKGVGRQLLLSNPCRHWS